MTEVKPNILPSKQAAALATILLLVAIIVLVVDWKIKDSILRESKKLRADIGSFERKYYESQVTGIARGIADVATANRDRMDRATGVEEKAPDSARTAGSRKGSTRPRIVPEPGAGDGSVEVPQGDGGMGA